MIRAFGEGEKNVRMGEGVGPAIGIGRSGEGEKNVRVGRVEVKINGVAGNMKGRTRETERGVSPVLKISEERRPKEGKKVDTIFLNVDDNGRAHRVTEEDMDVVHMPTKPVEHNTPVVCEYESDPIDREWAASGIVATIASGETTLSIQQRLDDTSLNLVEVIPMEGGRIFLRTRNNEDIWEVFNEAPDFFNMFFSEVHRCSPDDFCYKCGAWLRVYGTPTHAWNTNFFKLCVSLCGKYVQADDCTLDRGRIDFARILITTSSLEVLNTTTVVLVDVFRFTIKLVEEWGCNLGEDAFLTDEDGDSKHNDEASQPFGDHGLDNMGEEVDTLIQDLHKDWAAHEALPTDNNITKPTNDINMQPCYELQQKMSAAYDLVRDSKS